MGRNRVTTILVEGHGSTLAAVFATGVLALLIGLPDIFIGIESAAPGISTAAFPFLALAAISHYPGYSPFDGGASRAAKPGIGEVLSENGDFPDSIVLLTVDG